MEAEDDDRTVQPYCMVRVLDAAKVVGTVRLEYPLAYVAAVMGSMGGE